MKKITALVLPLFILFSCQSRKEKAYHTIDAYMALHQEDFRGYTYAKKGDIDSNFLNFDESALYKELKQKQDSAQKETERLRTMLEKLTFNDPLYIDHFKNFTDATQYFSDLGDSIIKLSKTYKPQFCGYVVTSTFNTPGKTNLKLVAFELNTSLDSVLRVRTFDQKINHTRTANKELKKMVEDYMSSHKEIFEGYVIKELSAPDSNFADYVFTADHDRLMQIHDSASKEMNKYEGKENFEAFEKLANFTSAIFDTLTAHEKKYVPEFIGFKTVATLTAPGHEKVVTFDLNAANDKITKANVIFEK